MKRWILWVCVPVLLSGWSNCLQAEGLLRVADPDSIGFFRLNLAERYTTNLIFPFAIAQVDLGSGDVIARKIGKAENVLLLKAGITHFAPTNVSVYLENGKLYSFFVSFADSLSVFNYSFGSDGGLSPAALPRMQFSGWPVTKDSMQTDARIVCRAKRFLKVKGSAGKVRLTLQSLYLKDKLLWLGLRSHNKSLIDFHPELMRFSIEDARRIKRTAVQSLELQPVYSPEAETLQGGGKQQWAVGFEPLTVTRGKRLVVEWKGTDGRRIRLVIKGRHILKARTLN